jgi:hypothetical protein
MAEAEKWSKIGDKFGPRCPNHRVCLVDLNWHDGIGICPISSCRFSFDGHEYEKTRKMKVNALGVMEETGDWKVRSVDGDNNG